jgi:hypothetical protein
MRRSRGFAPLNRQAPLSHEAQPRASAQREGDRGLDREVAIKVLPAEMGLQPGAARAFPESRQPFQWHGWEAGRGRDLRARSDTSSYPWPNFSEKWGFAVQWSRVRIPALKPRASLYVAQCRRELSAPRVRGGVGTESRSDGLPRPARDHRWRNRRSLCRADEAEDEAGDLDPGLTAEVGRRSRSPRAGHGSIRVD